MLDTIGDFLVSFVYTTYLLNIVHIIHQLLKVWMMNRTLASQLAAGKVCEIVSSKHQDTE